MGRGGVEGGEIVVRKRIKKKEKERLNTQESKTFHTAHKPKGH